MLNNININDIYKIVYSSPRKNSKYIKGQTRAIETDNTINFQTELFTDKQAFHKNCDITHLNEIFTDLLKTDFYQAMVFTKDFVYGFKYTAKEHLLTNKNKNNEKSFVNVSHNKQKNYILKEGTPVPALVELGVMTKDGIVVKAHYDKYRQINRFLEIIDDTLKDNKKDTLNIIDFGCGKSYLTFVVYHYLTVIKKIKANIIGLDLKEDVIKLCNQISQKYNYDGLHFEMGDVSLYKPKDDIDMIITLHACDTATDYAMYHAIKLNCKYLLSVPCCQHEINSLMSSKSFECMNKYGILKERFSALLTDSIRANLLEAEGYKVQVLEFVDFDASPKNLLIRAVKTNNKNTTSYNLAKKTLEEYNVKQTLFELLYNNK